MKKHRRTLAVALVVGAAAATIATVPAAARPYQVTVQLPDGTLQAVVLDLPEGTTLDQVGSHSPLPGTPVSLAPLAVDPPVEEAAPTEPPPAEPEPVDPPPNEPPAEEPPAEQLPPEDPSPEDPSQGAPPAEEPSQEAPPAEEPSQEAPADSAPATPEASPPAEPAPAPGETRGGPTPGADDEGTAPTSRGGEGGAQRLAGRSAPLRNADGTPTRSNPGLVDVLPGPSTATGVPNFIIRKFRVPPFLLPIYQAAGVEYGVRWEILAAINEIETDYGRNLNVSSAGALGWMQFMPGTWKQYGVDANKDGRKDPYNPVDAIFAAARYLRAAGYEQDVRRAIFAYNHADWYVDAVMLRARLIAGVPADLIGSLTGLTEGRFPVRAHARYADDLAEAQLLKRVHRGENAANVVESLDSRRSIDIFAAKGSPVIAVNDGVIQKIGRNRKLGRHVVLQDVYGNRYTYADLGRTAARSRAGSRVLGGATLGRVGGPVDGVAPHVEFSIQPAGRGAPRIDPKPILDGWKLLEATAIYRANGENVLRSGPTTGQILLLSKAQLQERVLADSRIEIYECGRADIRAGRIDRRVLATLAYLSESGLSPTVSSLMCGHSYRTKSGNVSEHSSGNAVDISRVNGIPVLGHQEPGGITDQTVRRLTLLQGAFAPHQVISLFEIGSPTIAMADHADHIHVGFRPAGGARQHGSESVLEADQWPLLLDRLRAIPNPVVQAGPQGR